MSAPRVGRFAAPDLSQWPAPAWVTDADGYVRGANDAARRLGIGASEPGEPDFGVRGWGPGDGAVEARRALAGVARDGVAVEGIAWSTGGPDGQERLLASGRGLMGPAGAVLGALVCAQRLPRDSDADAERLLAALFQRSPIGVVLLDASARIISFNEPAHRDLGYTAEEFAALELSDIIHAEPAPVRAEREAGIEQDGVVRFESRHLHRDGSIRSVWVEAWRLGDRSGRRLAFWRDVTDLREAERALLGRDQELRLILDSIPQLAWMAGPDGAFTWGNARFLEYNGVPVEHMDPQAVRARLAPEEAERVMGGVRASLAAGTPWEDTFRIRSADGEWRSFLSRSVPLYDDQGRVTRWFGTNTDVTTHVEARADLEFRTAVASMLTRAAEPAALVEQVTAALVEHLGAARGWLGRIDLATDQAIREVVVARGVEPLEPQAGSFSRYGAWLAGELAAGRAVRVDDTALHAGTAPYRCAFDAVDLRAFVTIPVGHAGDAAPGTVFSVGAAEPRAWTERELDLIRFVGDRLSHVQERDRLVRRLREEEEHFRTLAASAPSMVWRVEVGRGCTYMSSLWVERTGIPLELLLGWGWLETLHVEDRAKFLLFVPELRERTEPFSAEYRIRMADGTYTWHLSRGRPILDAAGRVAHWVGTTTDIDAQRRGAEALQAAVDLRDEFLAVASHELATPLTSMQFQVQGLRRALGSGGIGALTEDRLERMLTVTDRQLRHLTHLVGDLLDVSRLDHGRLRLAPSTFDLVHLVRDVADGELDRLSDAGCVLVLVLPESAVGSWDRDRLRQVLVNLLSNAGKYGPGSPVVVRVEESEEGVTLSVSDEGAGVAEEDRERIFERFERGSRTLHTGGLGLGLYICREALRAHGGSIRVESGAKGGATFVAELPWTGAGAPAPRRGGVSRGET